MNWNNFEQIISSLTKNPLLALIVAILVILLTHSIENCIGMVFRDIPKYLSETIIATYNFILSLKYREQIKSSDNSSNSNKETNDKEERAVTSKVIPFPKWKIK